METLKKMTHILIPIKDIQKEIDDNRKYLDSVEKRLRDNSWDKLNIATEVLENILTHKQISLDEKDIIKKANEKWDENHSTERQAYRQALKELLDVN